MYSTHDTTVLKGQCSWLGTRSCIPAITSLTSHIRLKWQNPKYIRQNQIFHCSSECGVIRTLWFYYKQAGNCINNFLTIVFLIKILYDTVAAMWPPPMAFSLGSFPSISHFSVIFFFSSSKTNMNKVGSFLFHSWKQLWWSGKGTLKRWVWVSRQWFPTTQPCTGKLSTPTCITDLIETLISWSVWQAGGIQKKPWSRKECRHCKQNISLGKGMYG